VAGWRRGRLALWPADARTGRCQQRPGHESSKT
jgi:hypothetical protein